jgi:hypothetical protein
VVPAELVAFYCDCYAGEVGAGVVTPERRGWRGWSVGSSTATLWWLFKGPGGSGEGTRATGFILECYCSAGSSAESSEREREVVGCRRRSVGVSVITYGAGVSIGSSGEVWFGSELLFFPSVSSGFLGWVLPEPKGVAVLRRGPRWSGCLRQVSGKGPRGPGVCFGVW